MNPFSKFDKVLIVLCLLALVIVGVTENLLKQQQANDFELDKMKVFSQENCVARPAGK